VGETLPGAAGEERGGGGGDQDGEEILHGEQHKRDLAPAATPDIWDRMFHRDKFGLAADAK
jgi:hypothetical protein